MSKRTSHGFTIIESMLFLAVTGVLIAGMIVGIGSSIAIQRYRDSVSTLKAFLQSQYSEINNVNNARDDSWHCDTTTANTSQSGPSEAKGQSDCVLLGRYIEINGANQKVAIITGYDNPTANTGTDITILKTGYTLGISSVEQQDSTMEWGTSIAWPIAAGSQGTNPTRTENIPASTPNPRSIGILIIRSPDSGLVYTFTQDYPQPIANINDAYLKSLLVTGITSTAVPAQRQRTLCIASGGFVLASKMAVYIRAYATNESAIETRSNEQQTALGSTTQC